MQSTSAANSKGKKPAQHFLNTSQLTQAIGYQPKVHTASGLSPMGGTKKNGMKQSFTFEQEPGKKVPRISKERLRQAVSTAAQAATHETHERSGNTQRLREILQSQLVDPQNLESALNFLNQTSHISHQSLLSSSGQKPKVSESIVNQLSPQKRVQQKSVPGTQRVENNSQQRQEKELLIQQLKQVQMQAIAQQQLGQKSAKSTVEVTSAPKQSATIQTHAFDPSNYNFASLGNQSTRAGTKKFDRLNLTTNLQGLSQLIAQSTTNAGSIDFQNFASGFLSKEDSRAGATANKSRITQSVQYSNGSTNIRRMNQSIGESTNTELESSNAVSRIGDTSTQHNLEELARQPTVVKPKVRAKHLLVKSTDRKGVVKVAKKIPKSQVQQFDGSEVLSQAIKRVQNPSGKMNATFIQTTEREKSVKATKQKSKSYRAPVGVFKAANQNLRIQNDTAQFTEDSMRIPSQPVTTSHQSMLSKKLEKPSDTFRGKGKDSQQSIHPHGVSSATNKVKKTFNFELPGSQSVTHKATAQNRYEVHKREILQQLLMHAVGQKHQQHQEQMTNQQLLMLQVQAIQGKKEAQSKVEIDTSRKAMMGQATIGSAAHSTKNQDRQSKKVTGKVAKSVGQSKPPAHAQYFEQASAPVSKGKQPNRKSSAQPPQKVKVKQDKMQPFSVININIDNGGKPLFQPQSFVVNNDSLRMLTNQPSESQVVSDELARPHVQNVSSLQTNLHNLQVNYNTHQNRAKHFSPRLQTFQTASQPQGPPQGMLTTTHLDKPSQFQFETKPEKESSVVKRVKRADDEERKQPLRLNIKRSDPSTKKEMETIAIFHKFLKSKEAKQRVADIFSARVRTDQTGDQTDSEIQVQRQRPDDQRQLVHLTQNSNVDLLNDPVGPASGKDKTHTLSSQPQLEQPNTHKRIQSQYQSGHQQRGQNLATLRSNDIQMLPESQLNLGFQTTKADPRYEKTFQIQTNNFVNDTQGSNVKRNQFQHGISPKSMANQGTIPVLAAQNFGNQGTHIAAKTGQNAPNTQFMQVQKLSGKKDLDAFMMASQTQNAPRSKKPTINFNESIKKDNSSAQHSPTKEQKGQLTLETNQIFYGRDQGNKLKTQDVSSLLRTVKEDLFYAPRETQIDVIETEEEACIIQQPAKGNQKLPIQPTFSNKKQIGTMVSSPKSIDSKDKIKLTLDEPPKATFPMKVRQALKIYANSGLITDFEKGELLDYTDVHFLGLGAAQRKIKGAPGKNFNYGYDDENGDYKVVLGDHIAYRFEVLDFLGQGSFGQALKCMDHATGEVVAIKIIRSTKRIQQQARVELQILQHLKEQDPGDINNIIRIKDSCEFRKHLVISFELFSINLFEFIRDHNYQGFNLQLIHRFAIQVLQALKYLREENVIHCDLKPENILLKSPDKSGIKIIDFGSSCFADQPIYTYIQSRFYRAPEIILGIPYTAAIDMWSFGCILVELFTGNPIFPGQSEHEQLALIMQVFGLPQETILDQSQYRAKYFPVDSNEPLYNVEDSDGNILIPGSRPLDEIIGTQSDSFFDFVQQCLAWDPEERITPIQALQHRWILESLPKDVLQYHQMMLGMRVPTPTESEQSIQETPDQSCQLDSCNLANPSSSQDEGRILNAQGEPLAPLMVNDFDESIYDNLNLDNQESLDQFSKQRMQGDLYHQNLAPRNVKNNWQQNRGDGVHCPEFAEVLDEEAGVKMDKNRTQPMPQKFLEHARKVISQEEESKSRTGKPAKAAESTNQTKAQSSKLTDQQKSKTTNMSEILRKLNQQDAINPPSQRANNVAQNMGQLRQQNPNHHPNRSKDGQFSFLMSAYIKQQADMTQRKQKQ